MAAYCKFLVKILKTFLDNILYSFKNSLHHLNELLQIRKILFTCSSSIGTAEEIDLLVSESISIKLSMLSPS